MGLKWAKELNKKIEEVRTIKTWVWLEVLNWFFGISGAIACLLGLYGIANVAIGIASKKVLTL